jgi:tRNA pseudouridine55 synthase
MATILDRELNLEDGEIFLVDKPINWTSFDVVGKMRSIFHFEKIGHAGTLDKNATGLLIVCTGKKTRDVAEFLVLEKEYLVTMRLGECTESFDAETPVVERKDICMITEDIVRATVASFIGPQKQVPPMWSAVKVRGKRLYKYARKGEEVDRHARSVFIKQIDVVRTELPNVEMRVVCSKGTYIRTLVNDIGLALGVGAHVTTLRRTRIGDFCVGDALTIDDLILYRKVHRN